MMELKGAVTRPSRALVSCSLLVGCAASAPGPIGARFDGTRFRNAVPAPSPSVWRVARHILFGRGGAWPEAMLAAEATPALAQPRRAGEVAVTFVNHATVLLQLEGLTILTDPVWSERVGPWSWAGPPRARAPGVPFEALPAIDVVLISHNHYDHLDLPTLERLEAAHHPLVLVPLGDAALLRDAGITRVVELDWAQSVELPGGVEIVFLPAQHNSGRTPWTADRSLWGSYLIRRGAGGVYFAGDTAYEAHFAAIRARYGPVDLALLPIGAYLPEAMMRPFHMSPAEAVRAQRDLGARHAVGIHYGTFQLSDEDFEQPVRDLAVALAAAPELPGPFEALPEGTTRTWRLTAPARASP